MTERKTSPAALPSPIGRMLQDTPDEAVGAMWRRHRRRAERRRWRPRLLLAGIAAVAAAGALLWLGTRDRAAPIALDDGRAPPAALHGPTELRFDDGSWIVLGRGGEAELVENEARWLAVSLDAGSLEVEVRPGGTRRWLVETDLVIVEVVGTHFRVHRDARGVRVEVSRGAVMVRSPLLPGRRRRLAAGDSVEVLEPAATAIERAAAGPAPARPMADEPSEAAPVPEQGPGPAAGAAAAPLAAPPSADWRALAEQGNHAAAWDTLGAQGIRRHSQRATPRDLLLLSDVARLAGHPADAVAPLEEILSEHRDAPEAPVAAFTLGRVHADALGRPAAAVLAFERALELPLAVSLRGDALARLAEAQRDAGRPSDACITAARYLGEIPGGNRRPAMQRIIAGCP